MCVCVWGGGGGHRPPFTRLCLFPQRTPSHGCHLGGKEDEVEVFLGGGRNIISGAKHEGLQVGQTEEEGEEGKRAERHK